MISQIFIRSIWFSSNETSDVRACGSKPRHGAICSNTWELYDMEADRTETNNLVDREPAQVARLAAAYEVWAKRIGAQPWPMPQTPPGARTGAMPMPGYLRVDRPVGSTMPS